VCVCVSGVCVCVRGVCLFCVCVFVGCVCVCVFGGCVRARNVCLCGVCARGVCVCGVCVRVHACRGARCFYQQYETAKRCATLLSWRMYVAVIFSTVF